ncbi:MAG: tetratricopeptide repeat protein [Flavobacteriales bacterium]|nr:tetratricopeptide repeat protein [Flavobacteriales bacterium]
MQHSLKALTVLVLATMAATSAMAQADATTAKRVQDLIRKADKYAQSGVIEFVHAETIYGEALVLAPDHAELNFKMGLCQLNGPYRHQALPYFEKARELGAEPQRIHFLTGYAYQLNARWEEAVAAYEKHRLAYNPQPGDDPLYGLANKRIAECRNGQRFAGRSAQVMIENLGEAINSMQADYGVLPHADGATILFTSRRPGPTAKVNKATREYYEDIHISRLVDGRWSDAFALAPPINGPGNDASVGIDVEGRTLLIYRDDKGHGDILQSLWDGNAWQAPLALGLHINTKHHESSAWITTDRQWIYFVSDRPDDNVGGQDIYRSRWDETTSDWGMAENLGPDVNSMYDEDGVFVTPDGGTIYFSSKGHDSMGGYDIFRSTLVDGRWTKAENLGWPINSPDDDLFFVLSADGTTGWFSSVRAGGLGEDDIYRVSFATEHEDTATPAR